MKFNYTEEMLKELNELKASGDMKAFKKKRREFRKILGVNDEPEETENVENSVIEVEPEEPIATKPGEEIIRHFNNEDGSVTTVISQAQ